VIGGVILQKICPACKTLNEPGRETCIQCAGALSGVTAADNNSQMAEEGDAGTRPESHLSLASAEGRVIRIRDGDIVGRTAVGREFLEIHEEISRRHAQFTRDKGAWFIMDLNSSNGTFLDGERIPPREKFPLRNGQRVMFSPIFEADVRIGEPAKETGAPGAGHDEKGGIEDRRKTVVILFADLKGSVDFFQERGTIVAHNWIMNLYRMLSSIIRAHRGLHIKNIGDAILAVFDDPGEAAKAAVEMQHNLREHNRKTDETGRYYLRIGMNRGPVLFEDRDIFGNAVNIASRVQALAPPERIFITEHLYEAIRDDNGVRCRFFGLEQLKGVKEKTGIYEILCDDKRETDGVPKPPEEGS
jgi:class 3 adenylate cyclase